MLPVFDLKLTLVFNLKAELAKYAEKIKTTNHGKTLFIYLLIIRAYFILSIIYIYIFFP